MSHSTFGSWASGLRIVPYSPFSRFMKPFCSPLLRFGLERVDRQERIAVLLAEGVVDEIAAVAGQARTSDLILAVMLFMASKTAWK